MCDCWRIGDESFAQGEAPFSASDFKQSRLIYEKCIENFDELEKLRGSIPSCCIASRDEATRRLDQAVVSLMLKPNTVPPERSSVKDFNAESIKEAKAKGNGPFHEIMIERSYYFDYAPAKLVAAASDAKVSKLRMSASVDVGDKSDHLEVDSYFSASQKRIYFVVKPVSGKFVARGESVETKEGNFVNNASQYAGTRMFFFGLADGSALIIKGFYQLVEQDPSSRQAAYQRRLEREEIARRAAEARRKEKEAAEKDAVLKKKLEDEKKAAEKVCACNFEPVAFSCLVLKIFVRLFDFVINRLI
jgi:hypothetical protein